MDLSTRYPLDAITSVDSGRQILDQIDDELLAVLEHRRRVSAVVQDIRRAEGGPRVLYSRENEVIQRYSRAIGGLGAQLALLVLTHCRGADPSSSDSARDQPLARGDTS